MRGVTLHLHDNEIIIRCKTVADADSLAPDIAAYLFGGDASAKGGAPTSPPHVDKSEWSGCCC